MGNFLIPQQTIRQEQIVKKSRFIAFISHAADPQASHQFIESVRVQFPDAGHVCWAFIAGEPGNTPHVSCSDDGEPPGTAGKPMLNVLQHSGIGEIVAVVVRYFGGIKLGTGGLVRAYSGSVSELIKSLPTRIKVDLTPIRLELPYAMEDSVRRMLETCQTNIDTVDYQEFITLQCSCPADQLEQLRVGLEDSGRGQIAIYMPDDMPLLPKERQ